MTLLKAIDRPVPFECVSCMGRELHLKAMTKEDLRDFCLKTSLSLLHVVCVLEFNTATSKVLKGYSVTILVFISPLFFKS